MNSDLVLIYLPYNDGCVLRQEEFVQNIWREIPIIFDKFRFLMKTFRATQCLTEGASSEL